MTDRSTTNDESPAPQNVANEVVVRLCKSTENLGGLPPIDIKLGNLASQQDINEKA